MTWDPAAQFRRQRSHYESERTRLEDLLRQAEDALRQIKPPSWQALVLEPTLAKALPHWKTTITGPLGLASNYHITVQRSRKQAYLLVREQADGALGLVNLDQDTGQFELGSIGYLNGLHHPVDPVHDSNQIRAAVRRQIEPSVT